MRFISHKMLAEMQETNSIQLRQIRESMARVISDAAFRADRLGLGDVAATLREAARAARREAEEVRLPEWQSMLR